METDGKDRQEEEGETDPGFNPQVGVIDTLHL